METLEKIRTVNRLPMLQQMLTTKRITRSARKRELPLLKMAAERLYADYMTDEPNCAYTT